MECEEVSKSYFGYKHTVEESKQRIKDDRELLLIEKRVLEDQLEQLKERSFNDKEYSVEMYQKKTDSFAERFRKLTQKNEHELKVVKIQYEQFQEQYRSDIAGFNQQIAQCRDKIKIIEQRRATETQAFQADIQSVKKRVINFERYIKRLKKHVDDEKTAELISELENTDVA